jgi:predicted RNase H-like HicB family nuclease
MKAEFTAIIEKAPEGGYWAICPEIKEPLAKKILKSLKAD